MIVGGAPLKSIEAEAMPATDAASYATSSVVARMMFVPATGVVVTATVGRSEYSSTAAPLFLMMLVALSRAAPTATASSNRASEFVPTSTRLLLTTPRYVAPAVPARSPSAGSV